MTVNVDGFNDKKELQLRNWILYTRPHVVILTETCTNLHRSAYDGRYVTIGIAGAADGVAAMIRQDVQYRITTKTTRIIILEIDDLVTIVGAYGPTEQTADRFKAQFWEYLTNAIKTTKPLLVAGDFNAGHEPTESRTIRGSPNHIRLERLALHHNLIILQTTPTWISKRSKDGKPSRTLDRILISEDTCQAQDNVVHLDWENAPADHAILTVKWTLNQISYHAKRPKAGLITRDADKPTTKAWLKLRNELKERFHKIPVKIHLPIQNQLLWDQYRRCNGQEGLTLMDDEGNDLNPEEARGQLAKMLQDRW
ncbi:endonuclease/exonuclease/phosphatase family protein, partial [Gregarina niphandrodes]